MAPDLKKTIPLAVRDLRDALNETQQQFADRMSTAVRTVARWESVRPPKGDALKALAKVADNEAKRPDIAAKFERALTAELSFDPFEHRGRAQYSHSSDGSTWGFLLQWLEGKEECEFGQCFCDAINRLHSREKGEQYRQALREFAEHVAAIRSKK